MSTKETMEERFDEKFLNMKTYLRMGEWSYADAVEVRSFISAEVERGKGEAYQAALESKYGLGTERIIKATKALTQKEERAKFGEIVRWMLGYGKGEWFPAKQEGDHDFYWRKRLAERMEEEGLGECLTSLTPQSSK